MVQCTSHTPVSTQSSEAASPNATVARARRSHKKSRKGCLECKQRHIRCDERHPSCANCDAAERSCSFRIQQSSKQQQKQAQGLQHRAKQQQQQQQQKQQHPASSLETPSDSDARSVYEDHAQQPSSLSRGQSHNLDPGRAPNQLSQRSLPEHYALPALQSYDKEPSQILTPASLMPSGEVGISAAGCCPGLFTCPDFASKAIFTPQHMILLHHADEVPNFNSLHRSVVKLALRHVVSSPYLMDEVLAFTAFHLTHVYPGSAAYLRKLATELQDRALSSFTLLTATVPPDDKATAVPRFFFSSLLGRHMLADALSSCHSGFDSFIARFVECINLNRGIRAVTPTAWEYLYNSEVGPFLSFMREAEQKILSPGNECDPLNRLIDASDLNEISVQACRQAIAVLQWSFDICHHLDQDDYPQAASSFSVRVEVGFIDVLRKHRPEALVIIAYYGVLLHRCRSFWAFADAGGTVIRAVAGQLGSYWQDALAWPLLVLNTEHNSEPLSLPPDILVPPSRMLN